MIAKTYQGLEEVLAQELTELGADNIEMGRRMVSFTGNKEMLYRANFSLRTAIRILKPLKRFTAVNPDEVYEAVKAIPWETYLTTGNTFAVDEVIFSDSEEFRHTKFVAYRVKDAVVDYFREKTGKRPGVRVNKPDMLLNIHIAGTCCTLSLDSSGESLHRRGYRQEALEAPLSEVLAAGMILLTGWRGECDLIDPMCGSGTIPIEAALIARNIAPGVFRQGYAFEKWPDFDRELFETIYNDDSQEREFTHKIYGYDNSPMANEIATRNVKAAGVSRDVVLKLQPFQQFEKPAEKSIIVTNPPYGERISTNDLLGLYQMIGEKLKFCFTGNQAWILSYREECFDQIALKPTRKIPLLNGSLECQFRQYEIFEGNYKAFRESGERLSKEPQPEEEQRPYATRRNFDGERRRRDFRPYEERGERRSLEEREKRLWEERERLLGEESGKRPWEERERRPWEEREKRDFKPRGFRREEEGDGERRRNFRENFHANSRENFRDRRRDERNERNEEREFRRPRSGESYPERKRREAEERKNDK